MSKNFTLITSLFLVALFMGVHTVKAVGTEAGTIVSNTARVTYDVGGSTGLYKEDTVDTTVAEIIDVDVTVMDSPVSVDPGQQERIVTFKVTNLGNGTEAFKLTADTTLLGDEFDPAFLDLYIDSNGDGVFNPADDAEYTGAVGTPGADPELAPDAWVLIFSKSNIPSVDSGGNALVNGHTGDSNLLAEATTPGAVAATGTVLAGLGTGGVDVVVGNSGGDDLDTGEYVIQTIQIVIIKSAEVVNWPAALGAAPNPIPPVPGATVKYTVEVRVTGAGSAQNATVTDTIPAGMTYVAGSAMHQNVTVLTDDFDSPGTDGYDYHAATRKVTLLLGTVTAATANQFLTFKVTID
ncbi:MAG: DUF11 domain-containing protein [Lentisphaeria bacterium]|nr:DUF11 domain-containing protein [Lentisphaeria bacterium]